MTHWGPKDPQGPISILIAGGGTAGWIAACLIKKSLRERVKITLLESKETRKIGVGEATVPTLRGTLHTLGISEKDFLKECQATFKLGVRLNHWRKPRGAWPAHFYNPFGPMEKYHGVNLSELWLAGHQRDWTLPLDYSCSSIPILCDHLRSPKFQDQPEYVGTVDYGYHVDAQLLGEYLKKFAVEWGVRHRYDEIDHTRLNPEGAIDHLVARNSGKIYADLYVDCTGFQGLLINQALNEPFHSYSKNLLCDSAVALNVPDDSLEKEIPPYTNANAQEAGWIWQIPLRHRWGTGYVYSSYHLSSDQAEQHLRKNLGKKGEEGATRFIKMRVGRNRRAWVKNCLSVGLAAGFVEPLESSGIGFIYIAIQRVLSSLANPPWEERMIERFNRYFGDLYDLVRDYLILHYYLSNGMDSPFWSAVRKEIKVPESLRDALAQCKERFPEDGVGSQLVQFYDYKAAYLLGGFGWLPQEIHPKISNLEKKKVRSKLENLQVQYKELAQHLPTHVEYLNSL
jgi:tryptophan halogenase